MLFSIFLVSRLQCICQDINLNILHSYMNIHANIYIYTYISILIIRITIQTKKLNDNTSGNPYASSSHLDQEYMFTCWPLLGQNKGQNLDPLILTVCNGSCSLSRH